MKWEFKTRIAAYTLRLFWAVTFISIAMIAAMHTTGYYLLEPFRVPSDLHRINGLWGISWPESFHIYHLSLCFITLNVATNLIGLNRLKEPIWENICQISGSLGFMFSVTVFLYFFLQLPSDREFSRLDIESAVIFTIYAAILSIANAGVIFAGLTLRSSQGRQTASEDRVEND